MEEPEPALIRAATASDLAAFEHLVRAYQQHVWRFLRRLLGDAAAAEDVAQETFLRVFRRLPTFTFEAKFSTWLFQIAHNAGIDELRSRQRRTRLASVAPPPRPSAAPPDTRLEIEAALASLPVDLRETVVLVEVLGLRYHEVARVLDVPVGHGQEPHVQRPVETAPLVDRRRTGPGNVPGRRRTMGPLGQRA